MMIKKYDMIKRLSIVFIIALFVGVTISASAKNGETSSSKDTDAICSQFKFASISFSDADVLIIDGHVFPGFNLKDTYVAIGIKVNFRVSNGVVVVDPILKKEITLNPEDLVSMSFGILYMNKNSDPNQRDLQFARGFNVLTIQYI